MKVHELMRELCQYAPDTEVLTYIDEVEEYGRTDKVLPITPHNAPYSKGSIPIFGAKALLIRGWLA